jgi:hypothetical protein
MQAPLLHAGQRRARVRRLLTTQDIGLLPTKGRIDGTCKSGSAWAPACLLLIKGDLRKREGVREAGEQIKVHV